MKHNGFGLCVRAGFGAQSFSLLLRGTRSTKLQVYMSARLTPNPCYVFALIFCLVYVIYFFISYSNLATLRRHNLSVCFAFSFSFSSLTISLSVKDLMYLLQQFPLESFSKK